MNDVDHHPHRHHSAASTTADAESRETAGEGHEAGLDIRRVLEAAHELSREPSASDRAFDSDRHERPLPAPAGQGTPAAAAFPEADHNSAREAKKYAQQDAFTVASNGKHDHLNARELQAVAWSVAHYPSKVIDALLRHHVKLELAGPKTPAKYLPDGQPWVPNAGGYWTSDANTATSQRQYSDIANTATRDYDTSWVVTHELAHAVDDIEAPGVNSFGTQNDPKFQKMYHDYVKATKGNPTGKNVIDPEAKNYAATSPLEFFAEGAREYLTDPNRLRQRDRALYAYERSHINNKTAPA